MAGKIYKYFLSILFILSFVSSGYCENGNVKVYIPEDNVHSNERGELNMSDNWGASPETEKVLHGKSKTLSKTGLVYSEAYFEHNPGGTHPENADRLRAIVNCLKRKGLFSQVILIEPAPAPLEWITAVHTQEYVKEVERSCREGRKYLHSSDTGISARSYEIARLSVGGVLKAVDAVMNSKVRNVFCAIRPPGHHALKNKDMGFCIFNNVAIGARYIQKKYGLSKVLIVDWDVHHGNGTQDVFYDDPSFFFFSIHQYPFYPGTGSEDEKGKGKGYGYTMNVPLPSGGGDKEYIDAFENKLEPAALAFHPDFVIISAGFDAVSGDPIGRMNVTTKGFSEMTKILKRIAEKCCQGRIVSVLEGGYSFTGLAESVATHISILKE